MINECSFTPKTILTIDRFTFWSLLKTKVGSIRKNVSRENKKYLQKKSLVNNSSCSLSQIEFSYWLQLLRRLAFHPVCLLVLYLLSLYLVLSSRARGKIRHIALGVSPSQLNSIQKFELEVRRLIGQELLRSASFKTQLSIFFECHFSTRNVGHQ